MEFLHGIIGGVIGTIISLILFANADRLGIVENWHFFMDGQAKIMRTKKKFLIYAPRFLLGGLALPALFHYIWGPNGILGLFLFDSMILTAIALVLVESILMVFGIYSGVMGQPVGTSFKLSVMAIAGHTNLGFWVGWFYSNPF